MLGLCSRAGILIQCQHHSHLECGQHVVCWTARTLFHNCLDIKASMLSVRQERGVVAWSPQVWKRRILLDSAVKSSEKPWYNAHLAITPVSLWPNCTIHLNLLVILSFSALCLRGRVLATDTMSTQVSMPKLVMLHVMLLHIHAVPASVRAFCMFCMNTATAHISSISQQFALLMCAKTL